MSTQTLVISNTLDDGYEDSGSWQSAFIFCGNTNYVGLSFTVTSTINSGSTINSAYVRVHTDSNDSGNGHVGIGVEHADPSSNTRFSGSHLPHSATYYTEVDTSSYGFFNWTDYKNVWILGNGDNFTVDIKAGIQSLVTDYSGIASGSRINIQLRGVTGSFFFRIDDSEEGTTDPELFIDWTAGAGGSGQPTGRRFGQIRQGGPAIKRKNNLQTFFMPPKIEFAKQNGLYIPKDNKKLIKRVA